MVKPFFVTFVLQASLKDIHIMKKRFLSLAIIACIATSIVTSCNEASKTNEPAATTESSSGTQTTTENKGSSATATNDTTATTTNDVVDIAIGSADHTTLVAAVKAAGLVETLKGAGPFTVFAPTNAAFDALPKGTVEGLLKPEKKADLAKILTYHVVAGTMKSTDLKDGQKLKTVQGGELTVAVKDGKVTINGATVTAADLAGKNGVVHVLNAVVLPKN